MALALALPSAAQVLITRQDVHHDVSPPLRDMAASADSGSRPLELAPREAEDVRLVPLPPGFKPATEPDTALQRTAVKAPAELAPSAIKNFDGIGQGVPPSFVVCCAPPDTNGAVGLAQYVQWVNISFAVFDKSTTNIVMGPVAGKTLWTGFGGPCETDNDGDPMAVYDKLANRWVMSQFAVRTGPPFLQCVAVSKTSDATGAYNRYAFTYSDFDDYPKLGVWPDAYYVTFNMFGPFSFLGAEVCAYDRNAMLNGLPATQVCFQQGSSVSSLLPSDVDGSTLPPAGSPDYVMTLNVNSLDLYKFHVDFATPANSTLTGPLNIPVAPFTPICGGGRNCVPQPGDLTLLDGISDRLMYRLAYRNFGDHESLVVNHSVDTSAGAGVRWYEVQNPSGTPVVAQQSTYAPDSSFRWMGSIAMDAIGDIALGYSVSSSSMFPSVAFAARSSIDPASTLGAETILIAGAGAQTGNLTRWGDYSAMQIDPVDDCTFWYTTEYLKTSGTFNWNTRIASFKFPACNAPDLIVSKTHPGNFTQGQTGATYTITVKNAGGKPTSGTVTVSDTLPAKLTATAATGTGWTCTPGATTTCTRSDVLAPGASYPAITLTVDVATDAPGVITNTVTVSGGGDIDPGNSSASDPATVIQLGPDLTPTKTHTGDFFKGQTGATYSISVKNTGLSPTNATVTVTDTLPAGMTATAASGTGWTCAPGATTTCTRSDALASGATYPAITLTVNVSASASSLLTNTVTVSGGGDTNNLNDSASDPTTIIPPPPDLTITKTHTGNFLQGQPFAEYILTVSNVGPGPTVSPVSVTDTLPAGMTLISMFGNGWSCTGTTCTRSDALPAGAAYLPITLDVSVAGNAPSTVTNTATVSGGGELNTANDTATDPTTILPAPDLTMAMSHAPDPFSVGGTGTYTITVSNIGNGASSGPVSVTDNLPSGMTATSITGTGWNCSGTNVVICTRSDALAAGAAYPSISLTVGITSARGSSTVNQAFVSGGGEVNLGNSGASDLTHINAPSLSLSMAHSGDFVVGQPGTYVLTVTNLGTTSTVGTVTVSDFLPFGVVAIAMRGDGWTCNTPPNSFMSCTRSDPLSIAASYPPISLTVNVTASSGPIFTNNATLSGGGDLTFHFAGDQTNIIAPTLSISLSHTGNFTVGQPGAYTITVSNTGRIATFGAVTVSDSLPGNMTSAGMSGTGWNCSGVTVSCTRSDALSPGQSYPPLTLTVNVLSGGAMFTNNASVFGGGDLFHNASDPTVVTAPVLAVTMTHTGNFTVGQTGVYTIAISNTGSVATSGTVTLTSFLPSALTATATAGTGWSCSALTTPFLTCTRSDSLAPGAAYPALTLTVNVNSGPSPIFTSVNVTGGGDINPRGATDSAVVNAPALTVSSSHTGNFTVGQPGAYTITVGNIGSTATIGPVVVTDFLPTGMQATAVAGTGWSCSGLPTASLNCSRSDALAAGGSYPPLVVTVSVGSVFPNSSNFVSVSGGGDSGFHAASDATIVNTPALSIAMSHTGDPFIVGGTGTYTITVSNQAFATAATAGTVTVTDQLPGGMTAIGASGTGWACSGATPVTCTRSDSLAINSSYPPINVTVSVGNSLPSVTNFANVGGGGDFFSHSASDLTNIGTPVLAIAMSHTGSFTAGQTGSYNITVSNTGNIATVGAVTVTDFLPFNMSATGATGTGWICSGSTILTCTRSDSLAAKASYPAITVTVNVTGGGQLVTNSASVTGGGDAQNHVANDLTNINIPTLGIALSHTGNFTVGQPGSYNITVSNTSSIATISTVAVTNFLPSGMTMIALNASGWNCNPPPTTFVNCQRADSLAASASYPTITVTVSVDPVAQPLMIASANVTGGGDVTTHIANDAIAVNLPDLAISATHSGDFTIGQPGAYTVTITNAGPVATAGGTVTVADFLPGGLTSAGALGDGWSCSDVAGPPAQVTCNRPAGVLTQGSSYPPITVNVNVDSAASSPLTNVADVFGIGETSFGNNTALDSTVVTGFRFVPVAPCRVVDTRNPSGPFGGPFLAGNSSRGFAIPASACGIPASAQAYSLNVTVVPKTTLGFLTMFPCGQPLPLASTLNSIDGRVKAGAAIIPAGTGGSVCAFPTNDTELVLDINGYFVPASDPAGLSFYPLAPCRVVDTRLPNAPLAGPALVGNAARTFPVLTSSCNIPATAKAYSFNYTSVPNGSLGFLTTWPAGLAQPLVSTLNAPTGTVTANAAIVPAGTNGDISVFVTNDSNLVIDVNGYFAPPGPGGLSLYPMTPCRVLDTRNPAGTPPFSGTISLNVVKTNCGVPATAQSYVVNATVVPPGLLGFLTLWPEGAAQPLVSTLNAIDGAVTSNMAIVPTANGSISAFGANPTHLVMDLLGFFAP